MIKCHGFAIKSIIFLHKIGSLTLYHTNPIFNDPRLLKTFWEKEKMLVTSIFSFSHNVFYSYHKTNFNISFILVFANTFNLDFSKILSFGKELNEIVPCFVTRSFNPFPNKPSPLQKHVRKVVGGFGKKSCVSTGVRKPGINTYASPIAMI